MTVEGGVTVVVVMVMVELMQRHVLQERSHQTSVIPACAGMTAEGGEWRRAWKIQLIETSNPRWEELMPD